MPGMMIQCLCRYQILAFGFGFGFHFLCLVIVGEVVSYQDDDKSRTFDIETSEDERRRTRSRSLKKRTANASMRLTNTLRRRSSKRVANCRYALISVHDVRDAEEEEAVITFREALVARNMLPVYYDDYHTMLR